MANLCDITSEYDPHRVAFYLYFGFDQTESDHLSTSGNPLGTKGWLANTDLEQEFASFCERMLDSGIAIRNECRETYPERQLDYPIYVLPPELVPCLANLSAENGDALKEFESLRVIEDVVAEESYTDTRERLLERPRIIEESDLERTVNRLHDLGLTSKYSEQDTPFLVLDVDGFRDYVIDRL